MLRAFARRRRPTVLAGGGGAAAPWYQADGAPAPVAAYAAVGAEDYAASLINLVNPGTNDLVAVGGAPVWTTENGWVGNGAKYFNTGVVPTSTYTQFMHYSDISGIGINGIIGAFDGGSKQFNAYISRSFAIYANTNTGGNAQNSRHDNGVLCIAGGKVFINGVHVATISQQTYAGAIGINLMSIGGTLYPMNGKVKSAAIYNTVLSDEQVLAVTNAMLAIAPSIILTSPQQFSVFQRSGTTGTISITGTLSGVSGVDIEASFNGGAYSTIASNVTGAFSGTLTNQAQGQGALIVRIVDTTTSITVNDVGIGDVFIVAGQSNASGRGTTINQVPSHATLNSGLFGNDYRWRGLLAKVDDKLSQVDSVSLDVTNPGGSVWIPIATSYMADQSLPCAFVPCAMGGTGIADWQPGVDHQDRTTLYGSMVYRALQTGAKAVLWWQGETDAENAMSQATYNAYLDTLANAINTDLGIPTIPCKLQTFSATSQANQDAINAAIAEAWADNANVLTGPDLTGLTSDDAYHLTSDVNIADAAALWWTATELALGW